MKQLFFFFNKNIKKKNYFLSFKCINLITIAFFLLIIKRNYNKNFKRNYLFIQRLKILIKGKYFIRKCLKGLLFNHNHNSNYIINKPKISVIIPIYNCAKTIKSSIRSIQNQNLSEIEIILVNDFSNDNSINIIKRIQKQDHRIKIINNNKNMGTLYSRCLGVLYSKGKFIFALDNDDMFFDKDVFYNITEIAEKGNFDIIGFKSLCAKSFYTKIYKIRDNHFSNHKNNLILHQPELGIYPISRNGEYSSNDYNIWGKCIKNGIYKKGVNLLGKNRYSNYIIWAEDTAMVFILFNIATSFKYIHKYGIIHLYSDFNVSSNIKLINKLLGEIFLLEVIFDFSKNNFYKNYAVYHALFIKNRYNVKKLLIKKKLLYLRSIINKIIKCKYITDKNKNIIKEKYKDIYY